MTVERIIVSLDAIGKNLKSEWLLDAFSKFEKLCAKLPPDQWNELTDRVKAKYADGKNVESRRLTVTGIFLLAVGHFVRHPAK